MSAGTIYTNRIIESAQAFLLRTKHRLSLCIMSQGRGSIIATPRFTDGDGGRYCYKATKLTRALMEIEIKRESVDRTYLLERNCTPLASQDSLWNSCFTECHHLHCNVSKRKILRDLQPTQKPIKIIGPKVMIIDSSSIIPPYFRFREEFLVAKRHRMAMCQIENVMSTIQDTIFCYLNKSQNFTTIDGAIAREQLLKSSCSDKRHIRYNLHQTYKELGQNPILFAVVRDPFERLISGYVDKCIREYSKSKKSCYDCPQNIRCFVHKLYASLRQTLNNDGVINFLHDLAPQNWYCDFRNPSHNYTIIKYEDSEGGYSKIGAEFDELLNRAGVSSNERVVIKGKLLKSGNSDSSSPEIPGSSTLPLGAACIINKSCAAFDRSPPPRLFP
ncbi:hypothetical protein ANCCEY_09925 [Ancylostoma ceylanicum]|uniref:Sulfotransferase domain-containing protein n=1 Tax=Ancylostoma ceylanicum TaxID=53326 RepID=A0A0D6LFX8_9BILA|nr:hypothetical protein ANCCEY_09925 [Ancylostoma ceylanicum]